MVKQAAHLLADAIRYGGKALEYLVRHLDGKAAKVFQKYSKRIANALDDIAEIPDVTVRIVKEKIISFMTNELRINPGTAQVIGEAIAGALWVFL